GELVGSRLRVEAEEVGHGRAVCQNSRAAPSTATAHARALGPHVRRDSGARSKSTRGRGDSQRTRTVTRSVARIAETRRWPAATVVPGQRTLPSTVPSTVAPAPITDTPPLAHRFAARYDRAVPQSNHATSPRSTTSSSPSAAAGCQHVR